MESAYRYELYINNLILKNNLEYIYPQIIEEGGEIIIEYSDDLYFTILNISPSSYEVYLTYNGNEIVSPTDQQILTAWQGAM